jgi:hypothetical protein
MGRSCEVVSPVRMEALTWLCCVFQGGGGGSTNNTNSSSSVVGAECDPHRKGKGRTGWPQHVWALELKQEQL